MFDKFTDRALKIISVALKESERFGHDFIGPEHLLLGLFSEGAGESFTAFRKLNINIINVRREIEKVTLIPESRSNTGPPPFNPQAMRIFECAFKEAKLLGHEKVGSGHILLSIISKTDNIAAQVLRKLSIDLDSVRNDVNTIIIAEFISKEELKNFVIIVRSTNNKHPNKDDLLSHLMAVTKWIQSTNKTGYKLLNSSLGGDVVMLTVSGQKEFYHLSDYGLSSTLYYIEGVDLKTAIEVAKNYPMFADVIVEIREWLQKSLIK
jgi:ATP-dependent Clp protease ATP-binding subunit ClpA